MVSSELKNQLINIPFLQQLTRDELNMLVENNKIVTFSPGQIILRQGQKSHGFYLIIDGLVSISAKLLSAGSFKFATLQRGNLLGEISLIENMPCVVDAVAKDAVKCLFVSQAYFEMLATFFPETQLKILTGIATQIIIRLKSLHEKIVDFIVKSDMATRTLFSEVIMSLTRPTQINFSAADIDIHKLTQLEFFSAFNKEESENLLKYSHLIEASKHCMLIKETQQEPICYIVLRGAVQSSIVQDNKIAKLSVIGPICLFCSLPVINPDLPALFNFTTCERAILLQFSNSNLVTIQNDCKSLWCKMYGLICKSLSKLERSADKLEMRFNSELYNR